MLRANRAVIASSDDRTLAAEIDTPYVLSMCFEKAVKAKPKARDKGTLFYMRIEVMRDIKFRAWDKFGETMITSDELLVANSPYLKHSIVDTKKLKLMQYTGLKDKNSNEIYEHDIAEISVDGHTSINTKVIFECGSFWLYSLDLPSVFDSDIDGMVRLSTLCLELEGFELNQLHQLEVVGNIHQHPELLEQKQ